MPLKLARASCAAQPDSLQFQNTLGFVLLRAGKIEESILTLDAVAGRLQADSGGITTPAYTQYALSLARHALGHDEQALHWYETATTDASQLLEAADVNGAPLGWNRRLTLVLLQREAASKLGVELPATGESLDSPLQPIVPGSGHLR